MSNPNQSFDKKSLLILANKILKANQNTINILRETPLCNLKSVQRNAKNTKDPAPLQSMIATISTKYPISVDTQKAKECGIPLRYLYQSDTHQFGRRRCSLEAVNWFMDNVPLPDDEINKAVDVLYRGKRQEVEEYYSVDWAHSSIRFGRTPLNRQVVETQTVAFRVPQSQRSEYLMAALMPHLSITYPYLDKKIVDEMKQLSVLRLEAKLSIQSQLRVLLNMMDTKPRYIPCLPNYPMTINKNRYVYASNSHLIIVPKDTAATQGDYAAVLQCLGMAVWYLLLDEKKPSEIKSTLETSSFRHVNLQLIVDAEGERKNMYTKLLFAVMGRRVETGKDMRGFEFTPIRGKVTQELRRNAVGVRYAMYHGIETIEIKGDGMLGQFTRYGESFMRIVMQKCELSVFKRAFAAIWVYLKSGFAKSRAPTIKAMEEQAYNYALDHFYKCIGISAAQISLMWSTGKGNDRIVFSLNLEPIEPEKFLANVVGTTLHLSNGQSFPVEDPKKHPMLPVEFRYFGSMFDDFLAPAKRLQKKIAFYLHDDNFNTMVQKIREGSFLWRNYSIYAGVPKDQRIRVAANARSILKETLEYDVFRPFVAYLYCFSYCGGRLYAELEDEVKFAWYGTHNLSLTLTSGEVQVIDGKFSVMGEDIDTITIEQAELTVPVLLNGFKLLIGYEGPCKIMSLNRALSLRDSMPEGSVVKIFMFGQEFILEKDSLHRLNVARTIGVRMRNQTLPESLANLVNLNKRLHDEADLSTIPVKKVKTTSGAEEEDEGEYEYDPEADVDMYF